MASLTIWHWLIVFAIVILVFTTKRLGLTDKDVVPTTRRLKKFHELPLWLRAVAAFVLLLYLLVIVQSLIA